MFLAVRTYMYVHYYQMLTKFFCFCIPICEYEVLQKVYPKKKKEKKLMIHIKLGNPSEYENMHSVILHLH